MSKYILFILFILFANCNYSQSKIEIGQKNIVHSKILNEDRSIQIHLPESYYWAEDKNYPVLYVLDGESNFIHTVGSTIFLSDKGEIPEMIIVAITSTVRIRDFTQSDWSSHWIGGGGAENFKNFLSQELIPKIEKDYRTNGFRILSGHSAAGQFVLYTLSSEPSLFSAYFAISPSLDWDNNLPQRSLENSFENRDSLKAFLYFAWSDDFGEYLKYDKELVKTLETKSPKSFRWSAKGYPNETHGSITLLAQIDALRKLFDGYRLHVDSLNKGFEFAKEHFEKVSKKVGYKIFIPEEIVNNFGYEELNKGDFEKAISYFELNIEQNPNSANAFDSLADAYEKAKMWEKAIAASQKAVTLAKKYNNPDISYFIDHEKEINERSK